MARLTLALVAVLLTACPSPGKAPARAGRAGLRVPLPDGWSAVPVGERLEAGPPGHPAALLESRDEPVPTLEALAAAVTREGVRGVEKESARDFIAVRYQLAVDGGAAHPAFLAVRTSGERHVWCSSAPGARVEDVPAALALCREVSWEAPAP